MGAQAVGCYGRIQFFLQSPEDPTSSKGIGNSSDLTTVSMNKESNGEPQSAIVLESFEQPNKAVDEDRSSTQIPAVRFMPKGIIAITGPSGCGKSTLLRQLLTFEESQFSSLFPSGNIAYCAQTPWIFEGSIRENIIGHSEVDNTWYQSVVRSCELHVDLGGMPKGDATDVGSGGSKLSGGQKQRIVIYPCGGLHTSILILGLGYCSSVVLEKDTNNLG
jgi:ABC-type transport system involved in cytochrome bd biosynthesis fused ATPase/permease subunit